MPIAHSTKKLASSQSKNLPHCLLSYSLTCPANTQSFILSADHSDMPLSDQPIYKRTEIYRPLNDAAREIRVMSLCTGLHSEPLECELIHASMDNPTVEYEALSYRWGDPTYINSVSIYGHELQIHGSLEAALRQLRFADRPRLLWTDAICINQAEIPERNKQVANMSRVYANAMRVIVWLGVPTEDIKLALGMVKELNSEAKFNTPIMDLLRDPRNLRRWKAIFSLCDNEYWNRVWTSQEVICARQALIISGNDAVPFTELALVAQTLQENYAAIITIPGMLDDLSSPGPRLTDLQKQNNIRALQLLRYQPNPPPFLHLMLAFRAHLCDDPKDKVYGLVGMARDFKYGPFGVDYTLPTGRVYLEAAKWLIEQSQRLDVICAVFEQKQEFNLPSWVPDWTSRRSQNQLDPNAGYLATGRSVTDATFTEDLRVLVVTGCWIGTIDALGENYFEIYSEIRLTQKMRKMVQDWFDIAMHTYRKSLPPAEVENDRVNSFWRTLIGNRAERPYQIDEVKYRSMFEVAAGLAAVPDGEAAGSTLSEEELMQRYVAPMVASLDNRMHGRRFFTSGDLIMGLAPAQGEVGDRICLLMGCAHPVLLRQKDDKYMLVGEVYVHGYMEGEAVTSLQNGSMTLEKISIY